MVDVLEQHVVLMNRFSQRRQQTSTERDSPRRPTACKNDTGFSWVIRLEKLSTHT